MEDASTIAESDVYVKFNMQGSFEWIASNDSQDTYIDFTIHNDTMYTLSNDSIALICKLYNLNGGLISSFYVDTSDWNKNYIPNRIEISNDRIFIYGYYQSTSLPGPDKKYLTIFNKLGTRLEKYIDSTATRDRIIDIEFLDDNKYAVLSTENFSLTNPSIIVSLFDSSFQPIWLTQLNIPFTLANAQRIQFISNELLCSVTSSSRKFCLFSLNVINGSSQLIFQDDSLKSDRDFLTKVLNDGLLMSSTQTHASGTLISFNYFKNGSLINFYSYLDTLNGFNVFLEVEDTAFYFGSGLFIAKYLFNPLI